MKTKTITFAGTSSGGSSYIDRMVTALMETPRVDVIISKGELQDTVFRSAKSRYDMLVEFMDKYSTHGRISVTISKET